MKGGKEQTTKKPPVTTHLAQLLKNPDLLSMNLSYQSTREAFFFSNQRIKFESRSKFDKCY